ncbi:unnamed protein product [Closterium sp. NIES-64]|nr:unnamed protein product [Closterium sp. NIES-64]
MPHQPKKAVAKVTSNEARESAAKGHHSEPVTLKPLLKDVGGPFADETRISLVKKPNESKLPSSGKPAEEGIDNTEKEKDEDIEVTPPATDTEAPGKGGEDEEEEDDGYLSDDPEERFDPVKAGEIAARAGFSITLLIPIKCEDKVEHTIDTVKSLLALWRRHIRPCFTRVCPRAAALSSPAPALVQPPLPHPRLPSCSRLCFTRVCPRAAALASPAPALV